MKTVLELPAMYADHHVLEVRRILLGLDGVKEVYASSSFRVVELDYNSKKVTKEDIKSKLEEAGYTEDLALPQEPAIPAPEAKEKAFFRHTSAYAQTKNIIGFEQEVHYKGRAQWPCPGMGVLDVAVTQIEEVNNG